MILPIRAFGDPVLRVKTQEVEQDDPKLDILLANMFETMSASYGVGLAAPQIGYSIRLFIMDASSFAEDKNYQEIADELKSFRKVFINPKKIEENGEQWDFSEGCLSIPNIRHNISRPETITLEYYDEHWEKHTKTFGDIRARIIQHEYDHIEGVLFTDYLSPFKKKLISGKLKNITKGNVKVDYKMQFPK